MIYNSYEQNLKHYQGRSWILLADSKAYVLSAVLFLDVFIFVVFDSIYCSAEYFAIFYALLIQFLCYMMAYHADVFPQMDFFDKLVQPFTLVVLILGSFLLLKNGSVGMDIYGRTGGCPNTWLEYLK